MRQYIDQIDNEIIKLKFTSEELENYKQLAKEFWVLKETISKLEEAYKPPDTDPDKKEDLKQD